MMIKKLIYFLIASTTLFSCKKSEVEALFDKSANERAIVLVDKYKALLTDSQYGWKGAYYPNGAKDGGYSFYLKFDKNGNLSMYSDIGQTAADNAFETTFQVKSLQKPTLIFDTYSYLHELVNPDYNGGTGAIADLELNIDSVSNNSMLLTGNRNNTKLILTKLSSVEYESVKKGGLGNIYRSTASYISSDKFLNLIFPNGKNSDIFIDLTTKIFTVIYVDNNDIATKSSAYITTTTGIQFKDPIVIQGVTISELTWDNAAKSYYFVSGGKKINLTESKRPALPFYFALGTLFTDIVLDPKIPSQTAAYKLLYEDIKNTTIKLSTTAPVRIINDIYFKYLPNDGVFALIFGYTRTYTDRIDEFGGVLFYEPTIDANGNITFSRLTQTATLSGGQLFQDISPIVNAGVKKFTDIIETNTFSWDYDDVESKTATLRATKAPNFTIKGTLY